MIVLYFLAAICALGIVVALIEGLVEDFRGGRD